MGIPREPKFAQKSFRKHLRKESWKSIQNGMFCHPLDLSELCERSPKSWLSRFQKHDGLRCQNSSLFGASGTQKLQISRSLDEPGKATRTGLRKGGQQRVSEGFLRVLSQVSQLRKLAQLSQVSQQSDFVQKFIYRYISATMP